MRGDTSGTIRIRLDVTGGRVRKVEIVPRGVDGVAFVFVGHKARDLPGQIGAVFSLCSRAQTIAALSAIEAAGGVTAAPGVLAARDVLRLAEMQTQTAMRLALHWPVALGLPPNPGFVRACMAAETALADAAFGNSDWRVPGAGLVPGGEAGPVLDELEAAVARFVAECRLREAVQAAGLAGFGALSPGMAPETGAFTRRWDSPAVAAARQAHGPGLLARLEASLVELAALPAEMQAALAQVAPAEAMEGGSDGTGNAVVETVRGPLHHQVDVLDGIITAYAINAPTEANFRAGGPVAAGLNGAACDGLDTAARLHVLAIDPCVAFALEVRDA